MSEVVIELTANQKKRLNEMFGSGEIVAKKSASGVVVTITPKVVETSTNAS